MATRNVGFRLQTDGKAQVKNDFAEVRMAGTDAMNDIADAAEDTARRATAANDEYTKRQLDSWKRQAAAAKLNAARADIRSGFDDALAQTGNNGQFATVNLDRGGVGKVAQNEIAALFEAEEKLEARTRALITAIDPAWAAQQRYNVAIAEARDLLDLGRISADQYAVAQTRAQIALDVGTGATKRAELAASALVSMQARVDAAGDNGFGGWAGSAERSAGAFRQLIAEQEQMERRVNALRAAIDPAAAAQQRFDTEMAEARALIGQNAISLDEYVAKLRIEQAVLDEATQAKMRMTGANGQARQSQIMLGQQLQDFSVQVVSGQSVATAFAQQIGQAAFAVQGLGGKFEGVASFLTSGWGIAATIGLVVIAPLVSKILEGNDALDDAVDKLKKDAAASDLSRDAKLRFAASAEGVAAAIRESTDATRKSIEADRTSAEQANISAKQNLIEEISIRNKTAARLTDAKVAAESLAGPGISSERGIGVARSAAEERVASLQRQVDEQNQLIAQATARVGQTRIQLATESAARAVDPMARIKKSYDEQVAAAQAKARAEGTVTAELTRQLTQIERNRQAAIKAEQDRQSAANRQPTVTNQIGRNVTLSEARDIAEGIGGRVTSDHRSYESQTALYAKYQAYKAGTGPWAALAAKPGTSNHELDQALDVAKAGGVTLAKLIAAYRQSGVKLTEALDEGDHYHVAWKKTGDAARAATQERTDTAKQVREAAAAERELQQDLTGTVRSYLPARAAADDYAEALTKIQNLVGKGKLTIDEAAAAASAARVQFLTGQSERFASQFKAVFGGERDVWKDFMTDFNDDQKMRIGALDDAAAVKLKLTTAAVDELRSTGTQMVDQLLDPSAWDSWGDAGRGVLGMLKSEFIKLALLNPLKNLLNGNKDLPTLSSAIGSIGKLFGSKTPGANATGTENWSGGLTWVAENGPELVNLPAGSRVTPAADTRRMLTAANENMGSGVNHFHFEGAVMTQDLIDQMNAIGAGAAIRGAAGGAEIAAKNRTRAARRALGR